MTSREYFILGFTFFMGVFSGMYVYVTGFAPAYVNEGPEDIAEITFKLQGEMYGGCKRSGSCATFVLNENRRYELQKENAAQEDELSVVKGRISSTDFEELQSVAERTPWEQLVQRSGKSCSSYVDGIDYRYLLTYKGEQISLDTCGMQFGSSEASAVFEDLWTQMENSTQEEFLEEGITGYLRNQLDKQFKYDDN